jgi:hypothetical protein
MKNELNWSKTKVRTSSEVQRKAAEFAAEKVYEKL